jgi:hypothetical protein
MTQSPYMRRKWAIRRSQERRAKFRRDYPLPPKDVVFLATNMREYEEIRRDHPGAKVTLQIPQLEQTAMFDEQEVPYQPVNHRKRRSSVDAANPFSN